MASINHPYLDIKYITKNIVIIIIIIIMIKILLIVIVMIIMTVIINIGKKKAECSLHAYKEELQN